MTSFVIFVGGVFTILIGRSLLGRWFNHVSIFAGLWTVSLVLLEYKLLRYYPIQAETWLLIVAGCVSFVLGTVILVLARQAKGNVRRSIVPQPVAMVWTDRDLQILSRLTWILSTVAFLAVVQHWYVLIQKFGSVQNVIIMAGILYKMRVADEILGMIPYVDSIALLCVLFAGVITAATGRLKLVSIVPLIVIILAEMALMGRARLILAAFIFASGYTAFKMQGIAGGKRGTPIWRRALAMLMVIALLASGAELVRSSRGMVETFQGASRSLNTLEKASFLTPSIYLYITCNHVVFDQYLKDHSERTPIASNTFAPVLRILAKMGLDTDLPRFQRFYRIPQSVNTGTFLRELHADFGLLGVLLGPFFLSMGTAVVFLRVRERFRFTDVVLLGYLYSIVGMSLFYTATRNGGLLTYLLVGLVVGMVLDKMSAQRATSMSLSLSTAGTDQP